MTYTITQQHKGQPTEVIATQTDEERNAVVWEIMSKAHAAGLAVRFHAVTPTSATIESYADALTEA